MEFEIKNLLLDLFFPKYCLGCGKEGQYICKDCEVYLINTPGQPGLWEYNGLIKEAIHRIKFGGEWAIIKELLEKCSTLDVKGSPTSSVEHLITWVPMTKKKERERGFNQSEIIAKEIGKKINKPVVKLLEKVRETSDQVGLSREERLRNLNGCFRIVQHRVLGACLTLTSGVKHILLVDDVYTTGATMEECKRTLQNAGYKNIWEFTLARTI